MLLSSISFASLLLPYFASAKNVDFNPRAYPMTTALCPASANGASSDTLALKYVDINPSASKTLLLVHGWPSLWASWKFQIREFESQYRLIVPDLRGFGESGAKSASQAQWALGTTMADLASDLECIMKAAGVEQATCIGHDWGTQTCFEMARQKGEERISAVVGITIPYMPYAGPFIPIAALVPQLPHLAYQIYFDDHTRAAVAELDTDPLRTLRGTLRTVASPPPPTFLVSKTSFLGAWNATPTIPPIPFMSSAEEAYWAEAYAVQGFGPTLYFYQTEARKKSWEDAQRQADFDVTQPALSILVTEDPVANWPAAAKLLKSEKFLPNSDTKTTKGAHWAHMEYPDEVNALIREWLAVHYPAEKATGGVKVDEDATQEPLIERHDEL